MDRAIQVDDNGGGVNERIVEIPFVLDSLRGDEAHILDVGCNEAKYLEFFPADKTIGIDVRAHTCIIPHVIGDITRTTLPEHYFDLVLCVSTLDHIGFAAYGQEAQAELWKVAMLKMHQLTRAGGRLVLTVPFGKSGVYPFGQGEQKVFGADEWAWIQAQWAKVLSDKFYLFDGLRYQRCFEHELAEVGYGENRALGVLCAELGK